MNFNPVYDSVFYTFQNSFKGSIIMNFGKTGASLQFTPVYNPVSPKDIKPGMKIYNYNDSKFFTVPVDEIIIVKTALNDLLSTGLQGISYKIGSISVDEKYGISVTHYPQNGISRLSFSTFNDKQTNKPMYMIKYTLTDQNKQTVFDLGLEVGAHGFLMFIEFLTQELNYLSTYRATCRALIDSFKEPTNNNYNKNNYPKQNSQNYNNNNNNSQTSQQNSEESNPQPNSNPGGSIRSFLG